MVLDDEVCRYAALEVGLTRYGHGVQAGLGLCVALHIVLCGGNNQVAGLHLSNACCLCHRCKQVVLELCLSQCYAGQRSGLDGEGSRLRAAVVTLTRSRYGSRAGSGVGGVCQRVVGILHEGSLAVLNGNGRRLGSAVVDIFSCTQCDVEELCVGSYDAPLHLHLALEVTLTGHLSLVVAHVRGLVALYVVAGGRHYDGAGVHIRYQGGLLLLVVDEVRLRKLSGGQRGLIDGHLELLRLHGLMVGVVHNLIIYGIFLSLRACGNGGGPLRVVERVHQLAALHGAGVGQCLSLRGIYQTLLHGRRCNHHVGLRNGKLLGLRAGVVTNTRCGNGGGAHVHVVRVGQGVVGVLHQCGLAVLHGGGRLLLCAVIYQFCAGQLYGEQVGVGSHDAPLGLGRAVIVLCVVLWYNLNQVVAHVGSLVAADGVSLGGHHQFTGHHAGNGGRLLLLVVGQGCCLQQHVGQGSLVDGHADKLCVHAVVVGIAHHLVEYGVASCVDCCRQLLGIGLSVQRVLHLACLHIAWAGNATGSNQRLRLSVEGQLCHGSGSRRRDVGLVDGECLLHLTAILADTHDGSLTRSGVLVALVTHAEVGVLGKNGGTVLHCDRWRQSLTGVGHGSDAGDADVGMRQQLAVVHRELGVGALHHEREGVGVALYGGQIKILQQVYLCL